MSLACVLIEIFMSLAPLAWGLGGLIQANTLPSIEDVPDTMLFSRFALRNTYAMVCLTGVRNSLTNKLFGFTRRQLLRMSVFRSLFSKT